MRRPYRVEEQRTATLSPSTCPRRVEGGRTCWRSTRFVPAPDPISSLLVPTEQPRRLLLSFGIPSGPAVLPAGVLALLGGRGNLHDSLIRTKDRLDAPVSLACVDFCHTGRTYLGPGERVCLLTHFSPRSTVVTGFCPCLRSGHSVGFCRCQRGCTVTSSRFPRLAGRVDAGTCKVPPPWGRLTA